MLMLCFKYGAKLNIFTLIFLHGRQLLRDLDLGSVSNV